MLLNMVLPTLAEQEKALSKISAKATKMANQYVKLLRIAGVKNDTDYGEYLRKNHINDEYFYSLMAIVGNAECAIENNRL